MSHLPFDLDAAVARIKYFDSQPHPPSQMWYGLDLPLKQWAGLPPSIPVLLSTHHGVELTLQDLPTYTGNKNPVIVARPDYQNLYQEKYGKQAFRAGCPYVLHRRMNKIEILPEARGTLAFPAHSTHHNISQFDVESYADKLLALPDAFQPISVCLYWKDILLGRDKAFRDRGIPVYTAGHMFDPLFYKSFYDILKNFRYTTANHIQGTGLALSLEMGHTTFYLGGPLFYKTDGLDPNRQMPELDDETILRQFNDPFSWEYYKLFPRYQAGMRPEDLKPSPRLLELISYMHGADENHDPALIRTVIFQAYVRFHPKGQAMLKVVMESIRLLQTGQYEAAFADQPEMLDFCRAVCRYPHMVFQS